MVDEISDWRNDINELDNQLLKILEKRFRLCREIGKSKLKNGFSIEDKQREKEIIQLKYEENNLPKDFIEDFFNLIFKESKRLQGELR